MQYATFRDDKALLSGWQSWAKGMAEGEDSRCLLPLFATNICFLASFYLHFAALIRIFASRFRHFCADKGT